MSIKYFLLVCLFIYLLGEGGGGGSVCVGVFFFFVLFYLLLLSCTSSQSVLHWRENVPSLGGCLRFLFVY